MSTISLSGLATGMDTENVIDQLMAIERQPLYKYEEEKSLINTKKDTWRDINSRISSLETKLSDLKLSSTFDSNQAVSSDEEVLTASASNDASEGIYEVTINSIARTHRLGSTFQVDSADNYLTDELSMADISGDIEINGTVITVDNTDTLNSLMEKINDAESGVQASIVDGHLVLESNETGTDNEITLTDNANGILSALGLDGDLNDINNAAVLQVAKNAEIEINGITGITSQDNDFSEAVTGITFTIENNAEINDTASIEVSRDIENASTKLQEFVDQYNSVMDFISEKTEYDSDSNQAAILQGDSILSRLEMRIRRLVTDTIDTTGDYNHLGTIGISIDREGIMSFDSDKLTTALEEAPEEVKNLFNATQEDEGFDGVATRLDSYLDQLIKINTGVIPRRLDYFDEQINTIDDSIESLERRLESTRERYEEQFTAMETAISEMNQQQSWLSSQLSSLSNWNWSTDNN